MIFKLIKYTFVILFISLVFSCNSTNPKVDVEKKDDEQVVAMNQQIKSYLNEIFKIDLVKIQSQKIILIPCIGCVGCDVFIFNKIKTLTENNAIVVICESNRSDLPLEDAVKAKANIYIDSASVMQQYLFGLGYPRIISIQAGEITETNFIEPTEKEKVWKNIFN